MHFDCGFGTCIRCGCKVFRLNIVRVSNIFRG